MNKPNIRPKQPYKPDRTRRARKSVYNSWLPVKIARLPVVQKFRKMSRRRRVALVSWTVLSVLVLIGLFTTVYFANTLGSKNRIMNKNRTGLTLVDQAGTEFFSFYNARSDSYTTLENIAPVVKDAAISSEDKDFYKHGGFSIRGISNAVYQNIRPDGLDNGGSTITQQLVKSALLSEKRSVLRKYQELILSIEIERRYSKDEILEMYLNSVYFGEGAFGIEDAALKYFNTSAKQLNLSQASLLIGLLPAPSAYSPISGDINKAKVRQTYVLGRMLEDNKITASDKELALGTPLQFASAPTIKSQQAVHFALMVKDELDAKYGEERIARSGYVVQTTLNLDWQAKAEQAVTTQVNRLARSNVTNGSVVVEDPKTGEIRALVGSKDWNNPDFGKFNIATSNKRQPGSSFKPIVFATGIQNKDFSAATLLQDEPTDFGGGYSPKNYDLRYRGDVTVRRALANSLNIPAVQALQKTGIDETISTAQQLGISSLDKQQDYGLSLALGTAPVSLVEMTNSYATLANAGKHNKATTIASVTDKNGKQIFIHKPTNKQVVTSQTTFIISSILSDNAARSEIFGSSLNLTKSRPAAVKTGTTEDYRDAWTIGYTPSLTVGVWIGNNDNSQMSRVAGSSGAGPIWKSLMQQILADSPAEQFNPPSGLSRRLVCRGNGALAQSPGSNTLTEYFLSGTLPVTTCNNTQPSNQNETPQQTTPTPQPERTPPKPDSIVTPAPIDPPEDPETPPSNPEP